MMLRWTYGVTKNIIIRIEHTRGPVKVVSVISHIKGNVVRLKHQQQKRDGYEDRQPGGKTRVKYMWKVYS